MTGLLERTIQREIDEANNHLPSSTIKLSELIVSHSPSFVTRNGESSSFRKEEIEMLSKEVPAEYQSELRLPIVILRRLDLGPGIFTIAGGRVESFLIRRMVVGHVDLPWTTIKTWKPIDTLARPEVQLLRRKMPSTTCIGFALAPDTE
ncbi:MAG: hypothetical protein C4K47_02325 [Candidatus Thorarchaeota archaeon]|nr:MAG: hypothetical protein C4K47_02325 [Candidatus Thorarchaeota archaeon]